MHNNSQCHIPKNHVKALLPGAWFDKKQRITIKQYPMPIATQQCYQQNALDFQNQRTQHALRRLFLLVCANSLLKNKVAQNPEDALL